MMSSVLYVVLSILSCTALVFAWRTKVQLKALASDLRSVLAERDELVNTVVALVDADGDLKLLALPASSEPVRKISEATKSIDEATAQLTASLVEIEKVRANLAESIKREEVVSHQLAELVDGDGGTIVKLRLPGKAIAKPPNRTPCGGLCRHASWYVNDWRCGANQGIQADRSRSMFLDTNNQCVMFLARK